MEIEIEQGYSYRVRYAIRPTYEGRAARHGMLARNGQEVIAYAGWRCEEGESYAGEWALILPTGQPGAWIASGDVEILGVAS